MAGKIRSKVRLNAERLQRSQNIRSKLFAAKDLEETLTKADRLDYKLSRSRPSSFRYEREKWLKEVEKKIKAE